MYCHWPVLETHIGTHIICNNATGVLFFIPASTEYVSKKLLSSFSHYDEKYCLKFDNKNRKKCRCCAWDSNP